LCKCDKSARHFACSKPGIYYIIVMVNKEKIVIILKEKRNKFDAEFHGFNVIYYNLKRGDFVGQLIFNTLSKLRICKFTAFQNSIIICFAYKQLINRQNRLNELNNLRIGFSTY